MVEENQLLLAEEMKEEIKANQQLLKEARDRKDKREIDRLYRKGIKMVLVYMQNTNTNMTHADLMKMLKGN